MACEVTSVGARVAHAHGLECILAEVEAAEFAQRAVVVDVKICQQAHITWGRMSKSVHLHLKCCAARTHHGADSHLPIQMQRGT